MVAIEKNWSKFASQTDLFSRNQFSTKQAQEKYLAFAQLWKKLSLVSNLRPFRPPKSNWNDGEIGCGLKNDSDFNDEIRLRLKPDLIKTMIAIKVNSYNQTISDPKWAIFHFIG